MLRVKLVENKSIAIQYKTWGPLMKSRRAEMQWNTCSRTFYNRLSVYRWKVGVAIYFLKTKGNNMCVNIHWKGYICLFYLICKKWQKQFCLLFFWWPGPYSRKYFHLDILIAQITTCATMFGSRTGLNNPVNQVISWRKSMKDLEERLDGREAMRSIVT